jgi:hypothetical protein
MTTAADPRDPRFRPFRGAAWGVYLVVTCTFSLLIIVSVFKSVFAMSPGRPAGGPDVLTVAQCVGGARALFEQLEQERATHSDGPATTADGRFMDFRVDWLTRERKLESQCALEAPERAQLKRALGTLEHVLDLYTTSSVQFATVVAPSVEQLRAELDQVK